MDYDGTIKQSDLKGKHLYWDIDGTLAPYRFNGHLADPDGTDTGMSLKEIEEGCFLNRAPSKRMQRVIETCGAAEHIILGHCHAEREISDKRKWVSQHFPTVSRCLFIADEVSKAEMLKRDCKAHGISIADCVLIDDSLPILREVERSGITSFHISSFLDYELE
jgi:FMN phosphatase YigB (HAD superfamily)